MFGKHGQKELKKQEAKKKKPFRWTASGMRDREKERREYKFWEIGEEYQDEE